MEGTNKEKWRVIYFIVFQFNLLWQWQCGKHLVLVAANVQVKENVRVKVDLKKKRKEKKITALRVPRLSPTLVLTEPEEA